MFYSIQLVPGIQSESMTVRKTRKKLCVKMYYLQRITEKVEERFQIDLNKEVLTVGRNPNADIICKSRVCSRRHGTIFVSEGGAIDIVAENTPNGIYVNETKIKEKTRLKINDVIGFGCAIDETTRADKTYYVFSLQKRENVTVLDDGVICLEDDDDDDYDSNKNIVHPIKNEVTTSSQLEPNPPAVPNDIKPNSSKSDLLFDNDGFKLPEPVDVYVPDEAVLESQSLIQLSIKREEEELFNESHSFNGDSDEEDCQPLTQIDIDVSDEEDCLILGSFSQQLNIDGVYRRAIKKEIKDEVLSDNDENIDDFFEEVDMPCVEEVPEQIVEPPTSSPIPFTQDIESRLASIMPENGSIGEMEYEEEMCTENLAALLDDSLPERITGNSFLETSSSRQPTLQRTPTKSSHVEPDVRFSKYDSYRLKKEFVNRLKSNGERAAEDGSSCTPLRQLEAEPSMKRSPELDDDQPSAKRIVRRRHSTAETAYSPIVSPPPPVLETPPPPQPTCRTTPPQLTPLKVPENQDNNKKMIFNQSNSTAEIAMPDEFLCTPLTACVTQLKAKMCAKKPLQVIDAQPIPKRRGRSKSVNIEPTTYKKPKPKKQINVPPPHVNILQPNSKKIEVSVAPKKNAPVVCKTTKNRGMFFIETLKTPVQPVQKRTTLPNPKAGIPNQSWSKSILKTPASRKRKIPLKFRKTCEVREYYKLYDGVLRNEPYSTSTEVVNFGLDQVLPINIIGTRTAHEATLSNTTAQVKQVDPRLNGINRYTTPVIPEHFEQDIKNHMDRILTDMLKWNCEWLKGPEEQPQLMPRSALRSMLCSYTCFKEYSDIVTRLMILELWSGVHRAYRQNFNSELRKRDETIVGELISARERRFSTHERLSFDCEFVDSQIKYRKPNALFVCLENGCHKIFGYVAAYRRDMRIRPVKIMLTIQVAKTEQSQALANNSLKRIQIRFITSVQTELKNLQAVLSAEYLPLMKFVLNPMLMETTARNEKVLLDQPVKSKLNNNQNRVIMDIYHQCANNKTSITLLEGPPGSGKSIVIANLIEQLCLGPETCSKNLKILICTQSNGAADNIACKLLKKQREGLHLKQLRYGIDEKIGGEARPVSLKYFLANEFSKYIEKRPNIKSVFDRKKLLVAEIDRLRNLKETPDNIFDQITNLEKLLADIGDQVKKHEKNVLAKVETYTPYYIQSSNVISSTLGFVHNLKNFVSDFDICIIDEATQCTEAATLIPFQFNIKHLVLIGDTKQLPATVFSKTAREYNLHRSLFTRIQETFEKTEHSVVKTLDTQYRMHPEIVKFPNAFFYKGRMLTDVTVAHDFKLIPYAVFGLECWQNLTQTLHHVYNLNEVMFVTRLLRQMRELADPKRFSYGVITPYERHRQEIIKQLQIQKIAGVTVNTVDSFQGQERDIIIISTAKTDGVGFLDDPNRLNVALTRAKHCLVICGNFHELSKVRVWNKLLADATARRVFFPVDEDVERPVEKLMK